MKKLLAILMVLVLVSGALFADPPTTSDKELTLTTAVSGLLNTKITANSTTIAGYQAAAILSTLPIATDTEGMPVAGTFYFNIRTNRAPAIDVQVKATSFTGAVGVSRISYNLVASTGTGISNINTITSVNAPDVFSAFYKYTKSGTGTQVDSRPITVTLDANSFAIAAEDTYTASVMFHVIAN